jgi:hypothetical protein
MSQVIYGIINQDNVLIDVSLTELGAKQYASRNGYTKIGFRTGSNGVTLAEKIKGKWVYTT